MLQEQPRIRDYPTERMELDEGLLSPPPAAWVTQEELELILGVAQGKDVLLSDFLKRQWLWGMGEKQCTAKEQKICFSFLPFRTCPVL